MSKNNTIFGEKIPFVEYKAVSNEQLGFFIDSSICSGCKACQVACKDKNQLEVGRRFRRVYEVAGGEFIETPNGAFKNDVYAYTLSISCNHCDDPVCVKNCPTQAMHKRAGDGIVRVDTDRCVGCGYCSWSCPYGAPQMNIEAGQMSKCDMCIDRLAEGKQPVCVESCPLHAIKFGKIRDLRAKYGNVNEVRGMPSANITNPNIVINPNKGAVTINKKELNITIEDVANG
ncbi:dimethylsulfoxide reductase subunit B [Vibrio parahaemolyticus]|nr:dimethylsulfoxide reductase subunit B [Vibrio parahaemolyticus]EIT7131660.1 dimethylsulfoxide reductase subunit B [Vibrio parahaemolyticus]EIZ1368544.1 dimethylsulfoxide reductase subunit B [Vibrio parahaemolyticus]EIZ4252155.1 dimethylsulfoxide reductase subunit B [Vibrio parahaemolyticus]